MTRYLIIENEEQNSGNESDIARMYEKSFLKDTNLTDKSFGQYLGNKENSLVDKYYMVLYDFCHFK